MARLRASGLDAHAKTWSGFVVTAQEARKNSQLDARAQFLERREQSLTKEVKQVVRHDSFWTGQGVLQAVSAHE